MQYIKLNEHIIFMSDAYFHLLLPFTSKSKEYVKPLKLSLKDPKNEDLEFVYSELKKILYGQYLFENIEQSLLMRYFIVYPYARIFLSIINKGQYYARFSEFYTKMIIKESKDNEIKFLSELGINYDLRENYFVVGFKDYCLAKINKDKDKLVNKAMDKGYLLLNSEETIDFIARYVGSRVIEGLPADVKGVNKEFNKYAKLLESSFEQKRTHVSIKDKNIDFKCFPACMEKILSELLSGGKPSHIERYYLATFLFALKMEFEKVLEIYSHASDYKESIAKYQLEKIKGYSPPSCNTLKSMGLCNDDSCNTTKSPMDYYFKCKRKNKNKTGHKENSVIAKAVESN